MSFNNQEITNQFDSTVGAPLKVVPEQHDPMHREMGGYSASYQKDVMDSMRRAAATASEAVLPTFALDDASSSAHCINLRRPESSDRSLLTNLPEDIAVGGIITLDKDPLYVAREKQRAEMAAHLSPEQKAQYDREQAVYDAWMHDYAKRIFHWGNEEPPARPIHEAIERLTNRDGLTDREEIDKHIDSLKKAQRAGDDYWRYRGAQL